MGNLPTLCRKRVAQAIVVILLAYVFTFVVVSILPGDPSPICATPERIHRGRYQGDHRRPGLDQPILVQLSPLSTS